MKTWRETLGVAFILSLLFDGIVVCLVVLYMKMFGPFTITIITYPDDEHRVITTIPYGAGEQWWIVIPVLILCAWLFWLFAKDLVQQKHKT